MTGVFPVPTFRLTFCLHLFRFMAVIVVERRGELMIIYRESKSSLPFLAGIPRGIIWNSYMYFTMEAVVWYILEDEYRRSQPLSASTNVEKGPYLAQTTLTLFLHVSGFPKSAEIQVSTRHTEFPSPCPSSSQESLCSTTQSTVMDYLTRQISSACEVLCARECYRSGGCFIFE